MNSDHGADRARILRYFRFWEAYRNPHHNPIIPDNDVNEHWNNGPYPATAHIPGPALQAYPALNPGDYDPVRPNLTDQPAPQFITEVKPNLGRVHAVHGWNFSKILGHSRAGIVGLWSWNGPPDEEALPRQIVVKEALNHHSNQEFNYESKMSEYVTKADSNHLVKLIRSIRPLDHYDPIVVRQPELHGRIGRLYLEYCELGDLRDLTRYRLAIARPFLEITLWSLFSCLVDACIALETGNETHLTDQDTGLYKPKNLLYPVIRDGVKRVGEWDLPILHFDLKPRNVFLARDPSLLHNKHPHTPICKIGDFGMSQKMMPDPSQRKDIPHPNIPAEPLYSFRDEQALRKSGTSGFYPPEQFTERWDYDDWRASQVAGNYSPAMNIWGIGNIMYTLVSLRETTVDIKIPFMPVGNVLGVPSKGITYGRDIELSTYSKRLVETVWACLYEKPLNRPTAFELKRIVELGYSAAKNAAEAANPPEPTTEDWDLFVAPWDPFAYVAPSSSHSDSRPSAYTPSTSTQPQPQPQSSSSLQSASSHSYPEFGRRAGRKQSSGSRDFRGVNLAPLTQAQRNAMRLRKGLRPRP